MTAADHWPGHGTMVTTHHDRGDRSANPNPTCRRGGCNQPLNLHPEWCDQHGHLIAAARAAAPPPGHGRHRGHSTP